MHPVFFGVCDTDNAHTASLPHVWTTTSTPPNSPRAPNPSTILRPPLHLPVCPTHTRHITTQPHSARHATLRRVADCLLPTTCNGMLSRRLCVVGETQTLGHIFALRSLVLSMFLTNLLSDHFSHILFFMCFQRFSLVFSLTYFCTRFFFFKKKKFLSYRFSHMPLICFSFVLSNLFSTIFRRLFHVSSPKSVPRLPSFFLIFSMFLFYRFSHISLNLSLLFFFSLSHLFFNVTVLSLLSHLFC